MKTRNGKVFGIEDNDTPRPAAQTESSVAVAALKKKRGEFMIDLFLFFPLRRQYLLTQTQLFSYTMCTQ